MAVIVHREEEMGGIFSPFLLLSWSLQKEGYKYQTIHPHLVARAMFVGKRKSSPPPSPLGSRHYNEIPVPCGEVDATSFKLEDWV